MIIDRIENAALYCRLGDGIATALKALQTGDLADAEPGRHELQGADVFALVQDYETKPRALGKWEAHRRYVDVQYVASGTELMGRARLADMAVIEPYDLDKDVLFLDGQGDFFTVSAGMFVVFFPHDVHMPTLAVNTPEKVRKIVVKVRTE